MKSPKHVVSMLVALTLAAMLSGCSKNTTPTAVPTPDPIPALDQNPPAIPAQIIATRDEVTGPVTIEWTASSSANAASYQIYQYLPSPDQENAYVLIGETTATTTLYPLGWVMENAFYRLRTTSTTGVQSAWSATVQVTVAPGGGGDPDPGDGTVLKTKP